MKITGYGPPSTLPFVPRYVAVDGVGNVSREGVVPDEEPVVRCPETEVAPGCWLGVKHDGAVEAYRSDDEAGWRARTAMETALALKDPGPDPTETMAKLKATSDLVGLNLGELLARLQSAQKGGTKEDLVETFKREFMKKK